MFFETLVDRIMKSRLYHILIGLLVVGMLIAVFVFYWQFADYYQTHFMPGTHFGSLDVSQMTADEVTAQVDGLPQGKMLQIEGMTGTESIPLADISFRLVMKETPEELLKRQNPWKWIVAYMHGMDRDMDSDLEILYDEKALNKKLHGLSMMSGKNIKAPKDACVVWKTDAFVVQAEDAGNTLNEKEVQANVRQHLSDGSFVWGHLLKSSVLPVSVENNYLKPSVLSDDPSLQVLCDSANAYKDVVLTVDCTDKTEEISFATIGTWFAAYEDGSLKAGDDGKVKVSKKRMQAYVRQLAKDCCTLHMTRTFKTSRGDRIKVQNGNDSYGFLMDEEAMRKALASALKKKKSADLKAEWNDEYCIPTCRNSRNGDIGDTYAEVSIDQQHMWLYKDGRKIFDTDVVTGKPFYDGADDWGNRTLTHTGVYFIFNKKTDHTMHGSYGSTHVNYWMEFTWDGEGFHDATWQSSFGGSRYKDGHGSHGCVNISLSAASELYDLIDYKTPVVVYQRK